MKYIAILGNNLNEEYGIDININRLTALNNLNLGNTIIITSGGDVGGVGITESEFLSEYLLNEYGIDSIQENKSLNTLENAINIFDMLNPWDELTVVTSHWHIPRTELTFTRLNKNYIKLQFIGVRCIFKLKDIGTLKEQNKRIDKYLLNH